MLLLEFDGGKIKIPDYRWQEKSDGTVSVRKTLGETTDIYRTPTKGSETITITFFVYSEESRIAIKDIVLYGNTFLITKEGVFKGEYICEEGVTFEEEDTQGLRKVKYNCSMSLRLL